MSRVAASASSPRSSRSVSSSPRTLSPSTLPRSRTVVSALSPSASPSATSSSTVLPSVVRATVSSVSSWSLAPRVVRLLCPESCVLPVPSP